MPAKTEVQAGRAELTPRPGFLLQRAGRWFVRALERDLVPFDVAPRHAYVLTAFSPGQARLQQDIASELGLDRTTTSTVLDQLESRDLVTRRRDPADRRRSLVELTDAGVELLSHFNATLARLEGEFFASLTPAERATLGNFLMRN
ncbi:MAG TPA: MarR family transcriptional regulator [Candidatus Dormibacteraeota bacterium]|nr:MarR family transcriptional regulator [Candidatus Dormibacteraeota bacterium]